MAGSERGGVLHADAALLENAVWVLTPDAAHRPRRAAAGERLVDGPRRAPIEVDPELHDRLVATVSHLPYLAAVALTRAVGEADERDLLALLAAGGFRDLTRVASGSPRMSRDMVVANRDGGARRAAPSCASSTEWRRCSTSPRRCWAWPRRRSASATRCRSCGARCSRRATRS
jgi:prephenate dehydrogenase